MQMIDAANLDYRAINEALRKAGSDYIIEGCCGQRFIVLNVIQRMSGVLSGGIKMVSTV